MLYMLDFIRKISATMSFDH